MSLTSGTNLPAASGQLPIASPQQKSNSLNDLKLQDYFALIVILTAYYPGLRVTVIFEL